MWWGSIKKCGSTFGSQCFMIFPSRVYIFYVQFLRDNLLRNGTCFGYITWWRRVQAGESRALTWNFFNTHQNSSQMQQCLTWTWNSQAHNSCKHTLLPVLPVANQSDWRGWGSRAKLRTCTLLWAVSLSSASSTGAPRSRARWNHTSWGTCRRPKQENERQWGRAYATGRVGLTMKHMHRMTQMVLLVSTSHLRMFPMSLKPLARLRCTGTWGGGGCLLPYIREFVRKVSGKINPWRMCLFLDVCQTSAFSLPWIWVCTTSFCDDLRHGIIC